MKRPLALRHLRRMHEMVTSASICQVVGDRALLQSPILERGAANDRAMAEEIVSLAREREWSLDERKPYQWQLMANYSDPRPRIVRILERDVFELDGIARDTDDDDVGALAAQLRNERRTTIRELMHEHPPLSLPGAK
ncbi:MAG TPA: hypothetical protein DEA08_21205 [Planctomycetes bacterium]|nr:hypothetical protein [Planctomycetota bacterium]